MKTTKHKFLIFIILLITFHLISLEMKSQDAHFSQFYNAPLTLNPALAGAFNGDVRILTNFRDQWQSVTTPYKTFSFSGDMGMLSMRTSTGYLGAGISFMSDKTGDSKLGLNQVNLAIAYHVKVSRDNNISGGIQCGIAQESINLDNLSWDNQYDGNNYNPDLPSNEPVISSNRIFMDIGAGMQWTNAKRENYSAASNKFHMKLGFAVFHLNSPNISFYSSAKNILPMKLVTHCDFQFALNNSNISLAPSFVYIQQGSQQNIIAGTLLRFNLIEESKYTGFVKGAAASFGGFYRPGDAIIPTVQLEMSNYAIGLSYDVNISDLRNVSFGKGGFEISLRYINPNPFTGRSVSKSPRFF